MTTHKPHLEGDGLFVEHDFACPVYWRTGKKAVYDCNAGVFRPSWQATADGWILVKAKGWKRKVIEFLAR